MVQAAIPLPSGAFGGPRFPKSFTTHAEVIARAQVFNGLLKAGRDPLKPQFSARRGTHFGGSAAQPRLSSLVVTSSGLKKSASFEILVAKAPYDLSEQRSLVLFVLLHNHVD